jgi:hypothetical protein
LLPPSVVLVLSSEMRQPATRLATRTRRIMARP